MMRDTLLDDLHAACFDKETGLPLPDSSLPECGVDLIKQAAAEVDRLRAEARAGHKVLADTFADVAKLRDELAQAEAKLQCSMGVGKGDGKLFVYGDYDSIMAAQKIVFRMEKAEARADAALALLREARINLDPLPQMYGEDGEDEASQALAKLCADIDALLSGK